MKSIHTPTGYVHRTGGHKIFAAAVVIQPRATQVLYFAFFRIAKKRKKEFSSAILIQVKKFFFNFL